MTCNSSNSKVPMKHFTKEEVSEMWHFLLEEIHDPETGLVDKDRVKAKGLTIWEKYRISRNSTRTATALRKRYSAPGFPPPEAVFRDVDDQVKVHFALGIPLSESQQNQLQQIADFDLDQFFCIIQYKDRRPGGLELSTKNKSRRKRNGGEENTEIDNPSFSEPKRSRIENGNMQPFMQEDESEQGPFTVQMQNMMNPFETPSNMQNVLNLANRVIKQENEFNMSERLIEYKAVIEQPTDESLNTINAATYLQSIDRLIAKIDTPELESVQLKIEDAMEKARELNKKIPIDKVKMMMEATLAMMGF